MAQLPKMWAILNDRGQVIKQTLAQKKSGALIRWQEWLLCRGVTTPWEEWENRGFRFGEIGLKIISIVKQHEHLPRLIPDEVKGGNIITKLEETPDG